jgi:hypothetical protein
VLVDFDFLPQNSALSFPIRESTHFEKQGEDVMEAGSKGKKIQVMKIGKQQQ